MLENDVLRATFLLGFGGRLWSLIHRPSGWELLFRNKVFQPANLGLRNAWFAGGVEWNIGATGHSPLTCVPLHAARVYLPGGGCALRLYEWERIRGRVVFAIDFWLPAGSSVLLTHVQDRQPKPAGGPEYRWSNAAVPESDGLRVLAPSETAHQLSYGSALRPVPIPIHDGTDATYPARAANANDHFFDTGGLTQPWIAALDAAGMGLVQVSTRRLFGRKLFCWARHGRAAVAGVPHRPWPAVHRGPGRAGSHPARTCADAGLQARWSLEAYGQLEETRPSCTGRTGQGAGPWSEVALDVLLPARLDDLIADAERWVDQPPDAMLHTGSGWGAPNAGGVPPAAKHRLSSPARRSAMRRSGRSRSPGSPCSSAASCPMAHRAPTSSGRPGGDYLRRSQTRPRYGCTVESRPGMPGTRMQPALPGSEPAIPLGRCATAESPALTRLRLPTFCDSPHP